MLAAPAGLIGVMRSTACQAAPHNLASLARNSHTLIKHEIPAHEEPSMRKRLHIALNATFRNVRLEAYSMINNPPHSGANFVTLELASNSQDGGKEGTGSDE